MNTANNFEALKQRIASSPRDNFSRGKLSHIAEILIVDDEESFVLSLADGLSVYKKYFNLRTAPNGAEAVKILKLSSIDLVITDLSMPKMDGFELLAYMNRNYPKIPVILMTAYGTPKIEEIVSNMGIFRYLEKPLDINVVADNIFDALGINISTSDIKVQIPEQLKKGDAAYTSTAFLQGATIDEKAKLKAQNILGTKETSKTVATFGSRSSISLDSLKKFKETTSYKKEQPDKKAVVNEVNRTAEIQEKKAILEAKAKAEAERFAREEAERKAKEAEEIAERARQEVLALEEAERKAREAEQRAEKARQEAFAREEAIKKERARAEAEEKAKQEALARKEAEGETKEADKQKNKTKKDLKSETLQKLNAWKKN